MEQPLNGESQLEKQDSKELSFAERLDLAASLLQAVDERNQFIENHGGFDTFAEAWQHVGDNRKIYDELENAVTRARQELDENIADKKAFIKQMQNAGQDDLAKRIARMFNVSLKDSETSQSGILSRFWKKL